MIIDSAVPPIGVFAQFCLDVQTALYTITGVTNRGTGPDGYTLGDVFIGHWEFYAKQEFYQQLAHQQFEFFIGIPKGQGRFAPPGALDGQFVNVVEMLYCIPADKPFSLTPVMQMIAAVNVALATTILPWVQSGNRQPISIEWDDPAYKFHEKPTVVTTKFILRGAYTVHQASNPGLNPVP